MMNRAAIGANEFQPGEAPIYACHADPYRVPQIMAFVLSSRLCLMGRQSDRDALDDVQLAVHWNCSRQGKTSGRK